MDRHDICTAEEATGVERHALAKKTTLRLLALLSFLSLLYSYFSGFSSYNIQFSTLIFSLFAHAMDRKYMFLICNGIVAFLVNNLSFSSSAQDSVNQIGQMPPTLVQENVASVEYSISSVAGEEEIDTQEECSYRAVREGGEETKLEDEPEEEEEEEEEEVEEQDEQEHKGEEGTSRVEEVTDASVSTEELNHKFEEFIRKMKEEIRIEAQQHLIAV